MTASFESKPERTDRDTHDLPTIPTVEEMETWDGEKVLRWIQQRKPNLLKGCNLENFNKADITGSAFLLSSFEFFKSCALSPGASLVLDCLVDEVKEGKLSNQTASRKKKGDEKDAPEPSISPKRNRQEDSSSELATRARERRKRIREIITDISGSSDQHSNSVDPLPRAVDKLSDPTFERTLAFPFVDFAVPDRFKVDSVTEGNWPYVGRTKFKELLRELKKVRESAVHSNLWLYGTQGYGKSHLLAALVCYLAAEDERVVYIPDCRQWLRDPVGHVRAATLFAWADDITAQKEIETWETEAEIEDFFWRQKNVIFVVDQLNALKIPNSSREEMNRAKLLEWLMRFTARHKAVFSTSANYTEYLEQSIKQNSNIVVHVYGGLNKAETDQWWKRHSDIDMGGYERSEVEDVTGCIPLLLEKCVVGGKVDLTVADLREIYDKAVGFVQEIRERTTGHLFKWQWYLEYVTACFCHKHVPSGWTAHLALIDHRYFYQHDDQSGRYTCGLIRDAVAEQLLKWNIIFADIDFLTSLTDFIDNPSVAGFMIEHAVLSSMRSNGLAIDAGIGKPMEVRLFTELSDIKTDIMDQPVLYRPQRFNFKAIDGIIVLIKSDEKNVKGGKKKLLMFPFQITLAPASHSDSHATFFKEYRKWTRNLSAYDVEPQFLWITPEWRDVQLHPSCSKWPEHHERYIPLKDVSAAIWQKYHNAKELLDEERAGLAAGCWTALGNITADGRGGQ